MNTNAWRNDKEIAFYEYTNGLVMWEALCDLNLLFIERSFTLSYVLARQPCHLNLIWHVGGELLNEDSYSRGNPMTRHVRQI